MALKVRTSKPQYWIEYERDGDQARFLVSPMTPEEMNKIVDKHKKKEWDRNQRFENVDFYGVKLERVCAVIQDWEAIVGPDDKPLPCTRENKLMLFQYETEMVDWVLEQSDEMAKKVAEDKAAEQKNSSTGRSK